MLIIYDKKKNYLTSPPPKNDRRPVDALDFGFRGPGTTNGRVSFKSHFIFTLPLGI